VIAERTIVAEAARAIALSLIISSMGTELMASPFLLDQPRENLRLSFLFQDLETSEEVLNLRMDMKVIHYLSAPSLLESTIAVSQVFLSSLKRALDFISISFHSAMVLGSALIFFQKAFFSSSVFKELAIFSMA